MYCFARVILENIHACANWSFCIDCKVRFFLSVHLHVFSKRISSKLTHYINNLFTANRDSEITLLSDLLGISKLNFFTQ